MGERAIKIGELLIKAGVVSQEELDEELGYARELSMPIGQVLVASGFLTKQEMLDAIQVQSLVVSGTISEEQAVEAVRHLCGDGLSLADSLERSGINPAIAESGYRLGELLMAAELLQEDELARALVTSVEISSPLGHSLVKLKILRPEVVVASLNVQKQLRLRQISYDEAIARLKAVMKFHKPVV